MLNKSADHRLHHDAACEFKLAASEDAAGTIEGYASVFGLLDRGGDIMLPGAFKRSLADWRRKKEFPPMLWQHDPRQPIGVYTDLIEDEKGLKFKGELILDIPQAAIAHALLKKNAIRGVSIGYQTKEADLDRQTGARLLKRVDLWEISLVTIPMLPEARIGAVKSDFDAPAWERAFRDGGLSNREAKLATSLARKMVLRDEGQPEPPLRDAARDALMSLRKAEQALQS